MADNDDKLDVLIAVDGSVHSDHAVKWYIRHIFRKNHHIHLVHVADPDMQPVYAVQGFAIPRQQWEIMVDEFKAKVTEIRKKYLEIFKKANIENVKFIHKNGDPGHMIVQMADEEHCEVIVVGTRGMGTVRRTVLGSVSDYVLHHANVPVAICRGV